VLDANGHVVLARDTIHLLRHVTLEPGCCRVELRVRSFAAELVRCEIEFRLAADFADVFGVRGARRQRRGSAHPVARGPREIAFGYASLDGRVRVARAAASPGCAVDRDATPLDARAGAARHVRARGSASRSTRRGARCSSHGRRCRRSSTSSRSTVSQSPARRSIRASSSMAPSRILGSGPVDLVIAS
jgi:hypothetical protein